MLPNDTDGRKSETQKETLPALKKIPTMGEETTRGSIVKAQKKTSEEMFMKTISIFYVLALLYRRVRHRRVNT